MNVESGKVARRKRKAPQRRVPTIVDHREQKPVAFGWGAHLSQRERDGLKERVALLAGIALAVIIAGLVAWGLIYDNVIDPANTRAENNKQVAQVGNFTINLGFFKRYQAFENKQFNSQITQLQQQQAQLQADPKKNALSLSQISQRLTSLQQALGSLPQVTLNALIDEQVILQRSKAAGVPVTPAIVNQVMTALAHSFGGPKHLQQFIDTSGLTAKEVQDQQVAQYVRDKLTPALQAKIQPFQLKVRASHVLLPAKQKATADKVLQQATNGGDFAQLAKKYSIDTSSAKRGGDLGFFTKDRMVAPFAKAAFSMKVGQIREVQSQFGWHIIKVTGRQKARLSQQELQQQQNGALQNWLQQQRSIVGVQRFMGQSNLPDLATPAPGLATQPGGVVPGPAQPRPGQPQPAQPQPAQPQPAQPTKP